MTTHTTKRTALFDEHAKLGAKMVPFAGFEMPIQYSGIIEEHMAVREAVGLFDVSHMGEVTVKGPHAFEFVQNLVTNDVSKMYDGRAMYSVMCNERGGIIDDLIVYRVAEDDYFIVVNASNIEKDVAWMLSNNPMKASITDVSDAMSLIAIQGPSAFDVVQQLTQHDLSSLGFYHFLPMKPGEFLGCKTAYLSHTGYTGEAGLEIYCENESAAHVWRELMRVGEAAGIKPAGLGARDTLRLESGYCLYGNDITEEINPLEAGLGWVTKLDKNGFIGHDALQAAKEAGLTRKRVGFVMSERGIPRQGYAIHDMDDKPVGFVSSGSQSPILSCGIGMGYVPNVDSLTKPGSELLIAVRDRRLKAVVKKPPFHKD